MFDDLRWLLVVALAATGVAMGLGSALIGLRKAEEMPTWGVLYVGWIVAVSASSAPKPFLTLLVSSGLAGVLHGTTPALLIDRYRANNPWYAARWLVPAGNCS